METKLIEVVGAYNWGKFLLGRFTKEEWHHPSSIGMNASLIKERGWSENDLLVLDLQTGEGALFKPGGMAAADLHKHGIWCCPMYLPFLEWLYQQDLFDLSKLPNLVKLPPEVAGKHADLRGYRRPGPDPEKRKAKELETKIARGRKAVE